MSKEKRFNKLYATVVREVAELSYAKRLKVGAIVVKDGRIISMGYNGTPPGWDNKCEDEVLTENGPTLVTRPYVIHAEDNAIAKLAKSTDSANGATMYVTHAPCIECAKIIAGSGISKVSFLYHYRDENGLKFLSDCGILTEQMIDQA
jgi:dCMP deaminase